MLKPHEVVKICGMVPCMPFDDDVLLHLLQFLDIRTMASCLPVSKVMFLAAVPTLWSDFDAWDFIPSDGVNLYNLLHDERDPAPWTAAWRQDVYMQSIRSIAVWDDIYLEAHVLLHRLVRLDRVSFDTAGHHLVDDNATIDEVSQAWVDGIIVRLANNSGPRVIWIDGGLRRKDVARLLSFSSVTAVRFTDCNDHDEMAGCLQHGVTTLYASSAFVAKYAPLHGGSLRHLTIRDYAENLSEWAAQPSSWNLSGLVNLDIDLGRSAARLPDILALVKSTLRKL
ncbi:hypothetical protein HK101_002175, partial [Irineochytrium annulatum]